MSEQLSIKELEIEQKLTAARERLKLVRSDLETAIREHQNLRERKPAAKILNSIHGQLADLSQQEQLEAESPFSDERFAQTEQIEQHYTGLREKISAQLLRFRNAFAKADRRISSAKSELLLARRQVEQLSVELEESRPSLRTLKVVRTGADGIRREFTVIYRRECLMPWSESTRDRRRFKNILLRTLILLLLLGLFVHWVPVPEIERTTQVEIPDRVARLVQLHEPPPPKPVEEEPVKEESEKEKKKDPNLSKDKAKSKKEVMPDAREKARRAGLFAAGEQFGELLNIPVEARLGSPVAATSNEAKARLLSPEMITAQAGQGSGGLQNYNLSSEVTGSTVSARSTSRVSSVIASNNAAGSLVDSTRGSRTDEEIALVFDKNKGALHAIYQRALRHDPTLKGKIVLKITIDASGKVLKVEVSSSDLGSRELEQKIVARVKLFDFGTKDVGTITITSPIDFFPI